jgi:hypothetical protein
MRAHACLSAARRSNTALGKGFELSGAVLAGGLVVVLHEGALTLDDLDSWGQTHDTSYFCAVRNAKPIADRPLTHSNKNQFTSKCHKHACCC